MANNLEYWDSKLHLEKMRELIKVVLFNQSHGCENFELNDIDWDGIWENCQISLVVKTWELWNEGMSTKEIANVLNIGKTTVNRYLHRGNEIGKCKFDK